MFRNGAQVRIPDTINAKLGGPTIRTVVNKTRRPIKISLPRGKILHLGPGGSGQVHDDALERPSVAKLIEAGEIEVLGEGASSAAGERASPRLNESTHGHPPPKVVKPKGNR